MTKGSERLTRADLEALVDTAPVGVAVFDARTGRPVSLNREVRRIVGRLHPPDGTSEELPGGVITCRRADGREVSLGEFPLARPSTNAGTARPEEIELSAPDGRRVRALVNATPIRAGRAASSRSSSPCRTWPTSTSWSGCGPSSWP